MPNYLSELKRLTKVQKILIGLNLAGVLATSFLLVAYEQDWSKLGFHQNKSVVVSKPSSQPQSASSSAIAPKNEDKTKKAEKKSEKTSTKNEDKTKKEKAEDTSKLMAHKNHNLAAADYAYDITTIRQYTRGELPYSGENLVFLTIDDGANHEITPAILDILKANGVHATFFPIGSNVTSDTADLIKREIAEGHAIGLHSFTHNINLLYPNHVPDDAQILYEAGEAIKSFKRVLGMKFETHLWRYPGGAMSFSGLESSQARLSSELGLEWLDWNAYIGDAEPLSRRPQTLDDMLAFHTMTFENSPINVKVVLLHDAEGKELTVQALPYIIQFYKDRGYTFGVLE